MDAETAAQFRELALLADAAIALARRPRRKAASDDDEDVKRLIAIGGAAVATLAAQYHAASITREDFIARATALLRDHAQTAAGIGAAQFGGTADSDAIDGLIDGQGDYLDGFADDIDGGGLSAAQMAARAALYGGAIWQAFQMGKGDGAADAGLTQCWWDLDPAVSDHCDDCPDLAEGSPYAYPDELPTFPGGDVQCGSNCRCALRFEGEADDEDKAAPPMLVKEARCPTCRHLEARNVNAGAELNCRKCRRNFLAENRLTGSQSAP